MGYIRKTLEKGYLEYPGLNAVLTTCLRFSSVLGCLCCLLPLFVNRQLPYLHTNSLQWLLFLRIHHKSLWCVNPTL